jgi:hypothetical protein
MREDVKLMINRYRELTSTVNDYVTAGPTQNLLLIYTGV